MTRLFFVKKISFWNDEIRPLNKQNNFAENPKITFERQISAEKICRKTELSTADGYLIEKFNFQPVK